MQAVTILRWFIVSKFQRLRNELFSFANLRFTNFRLIARITGLVDQFWFRFNQSSVNFIILCKYTLKNEYRTKYEENTRQVWRKYSYYQ
jgi:hypothetical protein